MVIKLDVPLNPIAFITATVLFPHYGQNRLANLIGVIL